jgi:hypothetical protein
MGPLMMNLARCGVLLVTVVMGVTCAACTGDSNSRPAASTARSSASGDVPPPPKVGQCRNTPASNLGHDDWVDNTPVVECSKAHTLETVEVIKPAEKLTLALAKQLTASCPSPAGLGYVGISFPAVRNLRFGVYWPSRAQRAAGQNWVRCDVEVQATTWCCQPAPQTGSLRGEVASDPVRFQICIDEVPDPNRSQPLASCTKPHRGELLPTTIQADVTHYPSPATLNKKGRLGCAKLIGHHEHGADLVITPFWRPPKTEWSGGSLEGFCFIHQKTGLMPPIG